MSQICLPKPQSMGKTEFVLAPTSETKRVTHDGLIWPVPRHAMKNAEAIAERMAEDFARVVRAEPRFSLDSLGWLPSQLAKYRPAAVALYKQKHPDAGAFSSGARGFAADAAELACLTLFVGCVGLWAIILGA